MVHNVYQHQRNIVVDDTNGGHLIFLDLDVMAKLIVILYLIIMVHRLIFETLRKKFLGMQHWSKQKRTII